MAHIVPLSSYQALPGKTVAISGCFDILHLGHIRFIEEARKEGEKLIILVESDEFIRTFKKRTPFHSQKERAEILSHIKEVDCIILLPFMAEKSMYVNMWKNVKPSIIALTEGDPYITEKKHQAEKVGAEIIEVTPLIRGKSSSEALLYNPNREILD